MKNSKLQLDRLEMVRHSNSKVTARCPACAADGGDRTGNHLVIFPDGRFGCAAMPGDPGHRRHIFALAGVAGSYNRDPEEERKWRMNRARERRKKQELDILVATARSERTALIANYLWHPMDVWDDSPQRIDCSLVVSDPRHFLDSLYEQTDLIWTGEVTESGNKGISAGRWRTCREWSAAPDHERVGPMVAPAIWTPGTTSRSATNVASAPYVALDFDGFDGVKPETPEQLTEHTEASLALIRWIRDGLCWDLAAILWTGGKSMHAWFRTPPLEVLKTLKDSASALGIDAGLIGSAEHPCRLPGQIHKKTGKRSKVLWLDLPRP